MREREREREPVFPLHERIFAQSLVQESIYCNSHDMCTYTYHIQRTMTYFHTYTNSHMHHTTQQSKKYHYIVSRHQDGSVAIQDGTKFNSPIELVQYHTKKVDGLLTTLKRPACRRPGQPPQGYRFISHEDMQKAMREAALLLGYQVR